MGGQSQEEEGFLHGSPVEVWVRERRVRRAAEERAWDVGRGRRQGSDMSPLAMGVASACATHGETRLDIGQLHLSHVSGWQSMNWLERAIVPWRDITKVADTRVVSCTQSGGFRLPPVWGFGATWVVEAGLACAWRESGR